MTTLPKHSFYHQTFSSQLPNLINHWVCPFGHWFCSLISLKNLFTYLYVSNSLELRPILSLGPNILKINSKSLNRVYKALENITTDYHLSSKEYLQPSHMEVLSVLQNWDLWIRSSFLLKQFFLLCFIF